MRRGFARYPFRVAEDGPPVLTRTRDRQTFGDLLPRVRKPVLITHGAQDEIAGALVLRPPCR